jgi:hypothetical protein
MGEQDDNRGRCEDCGAQGYDEWELHEGTYLCVNCASERTRRRGPGGVPQEWLIDSD